MLSRVTRYIASPAVLWSQMRTGYASRSARHLATIESGASNIVDDKDSFKVNINVKQFKPEEVSVKIADAFLVIRGKHKEKGGDHSNPSRNFVRLYEVPKDVDEAAITSALSSDGVLQLVAPKKVTEGKHEEKGGDHSYSSGHFVKLCEVSITSTLPFDDVQFKKPSASGRTKKITQTNKPFSNNK